MMACDGSSEAPAGAVSPETLNAAAAEWRGKHEADYRRDWVSIAGLHLLSPGRNTAGSAPGNDIVLPESTPVRLGQFHLADGRVRFEPSPGTPVSLKDVPVTGVVDLRDDAQPGADELVIGDVRLVVHVSGESRSIRVRLKVVNTYGDVDEYLTEGVVEFELLGQTRRLRPFTTRPGRLYFVFRDGSSGIETYETARFLYADLQSDGTTVLDFNMAYNPPCAFNPFTTCPVPLRENRLDVKILAGEKAYAGPGPAGHASGR